MVHICTEFVGPLGRHGRHLQTIELHLRIVLYVYNVQENREARRMWNAVCRLTFIVNFVRCIENMPWVIQWYGDVRDTLLKGAKMCMMIHEAADRLWLMKIWCVQWKRRFKRTDDSPFRHFPCAQCFGTENMFCLWISCLKAQQSTQVSIATL
jgi:hypothetical protein